MKLLESGKTTSVNFGIAPLHSWVFNPVDMGEQPAQCCWLLHSVWRRSAARRPLHCAPEFWRHSDLMGTDWVPGLPAQN